MTPAVCCMGLLLFAPSSLPSVCFFIRSCCSLISILPIEHRRVHRSIQRTVVRHIGTLLVTLLSVPSYGNKPFLLMAACPEENTTVSTFLKAQGGVSLAYALSQTRPASFALHPEE